MFVEGFTLNMFESLTERLQGVFKQLGRRGKLRTQDVDQALKDIRLALLEADVHYQVVTNLLEAVRQRVLSEEVSKALNPAQQVIRVIHDELTLALGEPGRLSLTGPKPRTIMLIGLQGSGKTTTAAKLARRLRKDGERPWLIAADPYRPAAVQQLHILGEQIPVPVYSNDDLSATELCIAGIDAAGKDGAGVVVLDTAGRSQLDQAMMEELKAIHERVKPVEILLVADAMTGQEAIEIARGFQESLGLTGLILTKMDGDARGGAAISMRAATGVPIKYLGAGETLDALESFEPDRLASRILGMGDVIGIIQKAEAALDLDAAEAQAERLKRGKFTLEDFAQQLDSLRRMGPLKKVLELLPSGLSLPGAGIDSQAAEQQLRLTRAILSSMTVRERQKPEILNASRKRRIAAGSGTSVQQINQLIRQYRQMRRLFKKMGGMSDLSNWPL